MPATYTQLEPFLRPEFPKWTQTEGSEGWEYLYRYTDTEMSYGKPAIGADWYGLPLTSVDLTPSLENSGVNELRLSTVYSITSGATGSPTLVETRYSLRYATITKPLIQHPAFQKGGASDLYTTNVTSGSITAKPIAFCMAWENEPLSITNVGGTITAVRGAGKFYLRDQNGKIVNASSGPIAVPSGGALAYVKLRIMGFDSYTDSYPVWQKISVYVGKEAPADDAVGAYAATAPTGAPTGYEWVKSGDTIERQGNLARWNRTEEWTGGKIYFDKTTLDPAGNKTITL